MKIKVYRSKISKKGFTRPSYPRVSRAEANRAPGKTQSRSGVVYKLQHNPVEYTDAAAIGFYGIRNLKAIIYGMKIDKEKFGACLNRLVSVFTDIVESENGLVGNFSVNGALFAFKGGKSPKKAVESTLIAALRMRYILNKLNRQWDFFQESWKLGFGIDYGDAVFRELKEEGLSRTILSGKPTVVARGIGLSASNNQIFITEPTVARFPSLETVYDIKTAIHVPVVDEDYLCKIREIVGITGPLSKKIYESFV